jgi:hypothetical protein
MHISGEGLLLFLEEVADAALTETSPSSSRRSARTSPSRAQSASLEPNRSGDAISRQHLRRLVRPKEILVPST